MASRSNQKINITIDAPLIRDTGPSVPTLEWFWKVTSCALRVALTPEQPGQVSLLVTDDATVRELNRQYRGLDEVTDVLSFSTTHPGHWEGEEERPDEEVRVDRFIFPPDQPDPLGEVIISYPQTCRQAEARREPVERELALLIVHGVLHLVGHDHLEDHDTALMQAKERAALATLFPVSTETP